MASDGNWFNNNSPGRPTVYNESHIQAILDGIEQGKSLASICRGDKMPTMQWFYKKLHEDATIAARYKESVDRRADFLAQDILDIADEPIPVELCATAGDWINRKRMQIDARKWTACKLKPKAYGDRLEVAVEQRISITAALAEAEGRLIEGTCEKAPEGALIELAENVEDKGDSDSGG